MKKSNLNILDRIALTLYALLGMAGTAALAYWAVQGGSITFADRTYSLGGGVWSIATVAVIAILLFVWSIRIMVVALRHAPKIDRSSVSLQNTENGSVRISVQAVDTLVRQAVGDAEGIVDIRTAIVNHEDSISVSIEMTLLSDVHIPNVTMLMQRSVKSFIEEYSGIAVREVTVLVSKIIEVTPQPPLSLEDKPAHQPILVANQPAVQENAEVMGEVEPEEEPSSGAMDAGEADDQPLEEEPVAFDKQAHDTEDDEIAPPAEPEAPGNAEEPEDGADKITDKDIW